MPRIFDNISQQLLTARRATLKTASHADFCVGYFNLRGWQALDDLIEAWDPSQGQMCRVLIGMQRPPHEEVRELYQVRADDHDLLIDNAHAYSVKRIRYPDREKQPKALLIGHFKQARGWRYDDKVHAVKVLSTSEPNWNRLRRSVSFVRFEAKYLGSEEHLTSSWPKSFYYLSRWIISFQLTNNS